MSDLQTLAHETADKLTFHVTYSWGGWPKLSTSQINIITRTLRELATENKTLRSDLKQAEKRADALAEDLKPQEEHNERMRRLQIAMMEIRTTANSVTLYCKCGSALGPDGYCTANCPPF